MGQTEIIQALKNLGGYASLQDLELEYLKIFYPPEHYGETYYQSQHGIYPVYKLLGAYLKILRKNHIITTEKVERTTEEYEQEYKRRIKEIGHSHGLLRKKTMIILLEEEEKKEEVPK